MVYALLKHWASPGQHAWPSPCCTPTVDCPQRFPHPSPSLPLSLSRTPLAASQVQLSAFAWGSVGDLPENAGPGAPVAVTPDYSVFGVGAALVEVSLLGGSYQTTQWYPAPLVQRVLVQRVVVVAVISCLAPDPSSYARPLPPLPCPDAPIAPHPSLPRPHPHRPPPFSPQLDVLTGDRRVLRSDILFDLGRPVNPAVDVGQVGPSKV